MPSANRIKAIFVKEYNGESLYNLARDVSETMMGEYNPAVENLPIDKYGYIEGTITVQIIWTPKS
ncbi:MAG: hypothetical protein ACOH2T_19115 [Pseudomonas sp.]